MGQTNATRNDTLLLYLHHLVNTLDSFKIGHFCASLFEGKYVVKTKVGQTNATGIDTLLLSLHYLVNKVDSF